MDYRWNSVYSARRVESVTNDRQTSDPQWMQKCTHNHECPVGDFNKIVTCGQCGQSLRPRRCLGARIKRADPY